MVKSNRESFDESQQIFYSKVNISRRKKSLKVFCEVSLFKIFNGLIHIIFCLRRVIRWIIRVHRQMKWNGLTFGRPTIHLTLSICFSVNFDGC